MNVQGATEAPQTAARNVSQTIPPPSKPKYRLIAPHPPPPAPAVPTSKPTKRRFAWSNNSQEYLTRRSSDPIWAFQHSQIRDNIAEIGKGTDPATWLRQQPDIILEHFKSFVEQFADERGKQVVADYRAESAWLKSGESLSRPVRGQFDGFQQSPILLQMGRNNVVINPGSQVSPGQPLSPRRILNISAVDRQSFFASNPLAGFYSLKTNNSPLPLVDTDGWQYLTQWFFSLGAEFIIHFLTYSSRVENGIGAEQRKYLVDAYANRRPRVQI